MSQNLPRVPVRLIKENEELIKSQEGIAGQREGGTDYSHELDLMSVPTVGTPVQYRTPADRENGNELFRRYLNGSLDISYAVDKVVVALNKYRDSGGVDVLNGTEKSALSILFPTLPFAAGSMGPFVATVTFRLSPVEVEQIRQAVSAHLLEVLNYNAGLGGGSVPGRHQTRS